MGPVSVRLAWAPAGAREQREHRRRQHLGAHTRGQRALRGTVPTLQAVSELFWWEGMASESERLAILSPRSSFRFWLSFQRRAEVSMCALGRCLCVRGRGEGRARRKARGPVSAIIVRHRGVRKRIATTSTSNADSTHVLQEAAPRGPGIRLATAALAKGVDALRACRATAGGCHGRWVPAVGAGVCRTKASALRVKLAPGRDS